MQAFSTEFALNMRRLRLRHLEVLLAIDRHGSLTTAAEALDATQPAVSQWLLEVEAALGVQLYTRGRQIMPTVFLAAALRHARCMMADSHQLKNELEAIKAGTVGCVRIGAMLVASSFLLPQALLKLKARPERLQLSVVEDIAEGLWARFERRELDVIVGRLDERAFGPHIQGEALFKDLHCVVVGQAHPLTRTRRLTWEKTTAFPWIMPPGDTSLRRAIDATFLDQSLTPPTPWIESASGAVTEELLSLTDCVAVLSGAASKRALHIRALSILPIKLSTDVGPVGMVWNHRELSPPIEMVLQALRDSVKITLENNVIKSS